MTRGDGSEWRLRWRDQSTIGWFVTLGVFAMSVEACWVWCHVPGGLVEVDEIPAEEIVVRVDLNEADWAELCLLPGVRETLARRIVAVRDASGPFGAVDDLARVPGIGPQTIAQLTRWAYASVDGAEPSHRPSTP